MAQIENEQYKIIKSWHCPRCHKTYLKKKVGIALGGWHPQYLHCNSGCGRYFNLGNKDIALEVESKI